MAAMLKKIIRADTVTYDGGARALCIATYRKLEGKRDLKRGSSWGVTFTDAADLRATANDLMAQIERVVCKVEREEAAAKPARKARKAA